MKYVVAVSGGVDSVVLLDMLVKKGEDELLVAHFDHGIRPDSDADARFVEALAHTYGLAFETKREELGESASEELARERRYEFLRDVADRHGAQLATAHHGNDIVESVAINLIRGTGWRGLAVLNDKTVFRPLLYLAKSDIHEYALRHRLEWVEDETNASDAYLRNRIRRQLSEILPEAKQQLRELRHRQVKLAAHIDADAGTHMADTTSYSRYFFSNIDEKTALELLKAVFQKAGTSLTRPQRKRALHAIKTMKPGSVFEAGSGVRLEFSLREFVVKTE